jgi:hypothetical protein
MFFSVFGGLWLGLWAYSELALPWLAVACIVLAMLGLLAHTLRVYRHNAPALRAIENTAAAKRTSRWFNIVNAAQWVLIFIVANLLSHSGHSDWILPAIIFMIGLHFLPLARLFRYRPHYLTGAALMALAIAYPFAAQEGGNSGVGALGAGLILWASALWATLPRAGQTDVAENARSHP